MPRDPGRKPPAEVMTPEARAKAIGHVEEGNFIQVALKAAGIGHDTYYHWHKRWKNGDEIAISRYGEFFVKLKDAHSQAECRAVAAITRGDPQWQSRAWFLERKAHARWGKKDQASPVIRLDVKNMSTEDLQALQVNNNNGPGKTPKGGRS